MKILLVSWSILPRSGGTSVIVEHLAENFTKDELIVFGGKPMRQSAIPKRNPDGPAFRYFFSELSLFGRGARFFSKIRKQRLGAITRAIKKIIATEGIDYVIGVFPDDLYCLAACRAAKAQKVPFSSYFHNTYVENVAITSSDAAAVQQELFAQSEYVFVMSKGMQQYYANKYKQDNFVPLVHTFNKYPDQGGLTGIPGADKDHYKLVAVGNFNESNIDATARLVQAIKDNPRYSLSVYTHVPNVLLKLRGIDTEQIIHCGEVAPHEVHHELQKFDMCVLTHGFTGGYGEVEYQTIFPTRTIPLLLSGKPIVAHSPAGSFLNAFIEENRCAHLVDEATTDAIITGLARVADDAHYQQQLVDNAAQTAQLFHGPNVVRELKSRIA